MLGRVSCVYLRLEISRSCRAIGQGLLSCVNIKCASFDSMIPFTRKNPLTRYRRDTIPVNSRESVIIAVYSVI